MHLKLKRAYDPVADDDGFRVLVDRLWPRGVRKEELHLDAWEKEIAPSTALRHWFNHDPAKWDAFRDRYEEELKANSEQVQAFRHLLQGHATVTLLYGAKDEEHNQAVVLRDYLKTH